ncbi:hypothetical protein PMAA_009000 [Talaromyces marneffei ATCC 18224]|uniref:Uncharacterized protein n=2 Tax=Talaromyces marneffei TaxID=37727 RepID=B6QUF6_TALMQ|nr:hypothetical protein PMAA_009000 [Talaromyces marneffei ATCC 18224]
MPTPSNPAMLLELDLSWKGSTTPHRHARVIHWLKRRRPNLKWSDVVALQWQKYASGGADLAYMFRANIQNENTKEIILQALISMGMTEVSQYLGVTIEVDASGIGQYADSFFALLGTYHGAGPAYLLAQHRSLFGGRVIRKVQVWSKGYSWRTDSSSGDIDFFIPAQYSLSLRCRATAKLLDEKN